jgi:flap endonuclease-1
MGIQGLHKFLTSNIINTKGIKEININQLQDKIIAVDASIFIYQFASAIKGTCNELQTTDGRITTHIQAILSKTLGMIKKKLKPVFIFDGKPPSLKQNVLDSRKTIKSSAKVDLEKININIKEIEGKLLPTPSSQDDIDEQLNNIKLMKELQEEKVKLLKKSVSVSHKQMNECKDLLKLLGIPIIEAPEEADPQCAALVKSGFAHCVASEDMDILTFGTTRLLRGLSAKPYATEYTLQILLDELGLDYNKFIDLCILLGCDYTDTIPGIGPKKAFDMIKKYGSIDNMILQDANFISGKYECPENFNYEGAREYFKNPIISEINTDNIKWKIPDYDELKKLLVTKYEYSEENIDKLFGVLQGGYYSVICGAKNKLQYQKDQTIYHQNIIIPKKQAYQKSIRENINFDSD